MTEDKWTDKVNINKKNLAIKNLYGRCKMLEFMTNIWLIIILLHFKNNFRFIHIYMPIASYIFCLFYSRFSMGHVPNENSIFFPNPQEKNPNRKLQNKKEFNKNFYNIWNQRLLHCYCVYMIEYVILASYSFCSLNHCKI